MMNTKTDEIWAFIPARGGSKSIPLKNMVELGGKPLISYVIRAAKASKKITRIICSTENKRIADYCRSQNVEVHERPDYLASDDTDVIDVLIYVLKDIGQKEGGVPDIIPILQPTSPFLLPNHIDECIGLLYENPEAQSSQTIANFPHNFHAYNQRLIENRWLKFAFPEERRRFYNKQRKPKFYIHGNLIVTRSKTILEESEIFGNKSLHLLIPYHYALDLDGPDDLNVAEWYMEKGKVPLTF
jgi:CMP-N-acetylneuraminic acid synthetase